MNIDRIVQLGALSITILALLGAGTLLPSIIRQSEESVLRYTNVSVEGAPPIVVVGTAIGALRGLIVDILWIKANAMKDKGLFYEAMADADLITKLQPRFSQVWSFHGHNMTYNLSVAANTPEERWEWVNAGIRLVRNEGLRYNPNDMLLHRELAFWFAHKLENVSDDAHLYYKRQFCIEWHRLLGMPPTDTALHLAWMKEVADAPNTLAGADARTPGVMALVERLKAAYPSDEAGHEFRLDSDFLTLFATWISLKQQSATAQILDFEKDARANLPFYDPFDKIASDPELQVQWKALLAHVRKRVLLDDYNMDPQLMYEYERDLRVPIEWRHPSAHALYWSRRGSEFGRGRLSESDIYISLNNDSQQLQAMQELARFGRISFDLLSPPSELPGRFPEPRWIDTIDGLFESFYMKNYHIHGAGGERFINFLQNFMSSAVCEWFRMGETIRAQKLLDRLDSLFGRGTMTSVKFKQPLDLFVYNETFDQYQAQPHVATRDIAASLLYGFKVGVLGNNPEVLKESFAFAKKVTQWFKENHWNDYITKFGEGRLRDVIGEVEDSIELGYLQMITNATIPMRDRIEIWNKTDRIESEITRTAPVLRALAYDRAMPLLYQEFAANPISAKLPFEQAFPPPQGLEEQRKFIIQRQQERERMKAEIRARDPLSRQ
jgi:hypothetical protein